MQQMIYFYLLFLILTFSASAPAQHRLDPPGIGAAKDSFAGRQAPSAGFKSDGCTFWFDADYRNCCVQHDRAYLEWHQSGGGWRARLRADNRLFVCVAGKGVFQKALAPVMWTGVRLFGSPLFPAQRKSAARSAAEKLFRFFRSAQSLNLRRTNLTDEAQRAVG